VIVVRVERFFLDRDLAVMALTAEDQLTTEHTEHTEIRPTRIFATLPCILRIPWLNKGARSKQPKKTIRYNDLLPTNSPQEPFQ
jgi:hypothetical protein